MTSIERVNRGGDHAETDFDPHMDNYQARKYEAWKTLRETVPLAHNEQYGGFWVASGFDIVGEIARDSASFSCKYLEGPSEEGFAWTGVCGVPRTEGIPALGLGEREGAEHSAIRRALNPYFLPKAAAKYEPVMRQAATWFLDQHIESGSMDLATEFAGPVTATVTMLSVGLPYEFALDFQDIFHSTMAFPPSDPRFQHARDMEPRMEALLETEIEARRSEPRADLISSLIEADINGKSMSNREIISVLWNVIGGGLDTTSSLVSMSLYHLDGHPDLKRQLLDDPSLLPSATEEFLRYWSVAEIQSRTVTKDMEFHGQQLKAGDPVLVGWMSANRDESTFEHADEVILDRSPNAHIAFGVGPHRCIGLHIARVEYGVMMKEILHRIPDYRIVRDQVAFYEREFLTGTVNLPATFTPGPKVGVERPY